ncbi:MAG: cobyrinate a,c-diamide synthase [Rhizobiaceae bacterium]
MAKGFIIAAPHSGSGKTTITLGLLRALKNRGVATGPAKAGPDFIDPAFHTIAANSTCVNLDPWAMRPELVAQLANSQSLKGTLVVEAMMGLFDGAADGKGSAADLAQTLGLPIVLVVDTAKQSHSIAALVSGFREFRKELKFAGVILNNVGSHRHEIMMREALGEIGMNVIGALHRDQRLAMPSRHLGLIQAGELSDIESFIDYAAEVMEKNIDLDFLLTQEITAPMAGGAGSIKPPGQHIAIAQDQAFAFIYPHLMAGWQEQGASLTFFSPLANERPDKRADFIYLPGGYPELHCEQLSANFNFLEGMREFVTKGVAIYGECGGYMVLGEALVDGNGKHHEMIGALPLVTSFEKRKLHLGYRKAVVNTDFSLGQKGTQFCAHEFHYSSILYEENGEALFRIEDARGDKLGTCGLKRCNVAGSYMHVIDYR